MNRKVKANRVSEDWTDPFLQSVKIQKSMNIEEFREYCITKPGVSEEFPFDENTLVFKVMGKMFALTDLAEEFSLNLKCDPERAIELRDQYPAIQPGYHMNKNHWNTVRMDSSISEKLILELIDHSYQLVVDKSKPLSKPLPKRERPGK
jgi:predicted DNA-binding protein (MmcQ/YjbR family)